MVYYFTSNVVEPSAFIYVGKDKFESAQSIWAVRDTRSHMLTKYYCYRR